MLLYVFFTLFPRSHLESSLDAVLFSFSELNNLFLYMSAFNFNIDITAPEVRDAAGH